MRREMEDRILTMFEEIGSDTETYLDLKRLTGAVPELTTFYGNIKPNLLRYCTVIQEEMQDAKSNMELSNWMECKDIAISILGTIELYLYYHEHGLF